MKNNKQDVNTQEQTPDIMPEPQQTRSVKDVLAENAIMIQGLTYTHGEAKKFLPIFEKIEQELIACVQAIEKEEQKQKEAQQNAAADTE